MKLSRYRPRTKRSRSAALSTIGLATLALIAALTLGGGASAASVVTVPLGVAGNFAVLASTGIHDTPTSVIRGDVGVGVAGGGGSITGLTCAEVTGTIYSPDAAGPLPCRVTNAGHLTTAQNNLTNAYGNAAGRSPGTTFVGADNQLGGQVLVAGVYRIPHATTANLIGNVTLTGDASSVWIFQASSDLVTAGSSTVTLTGGAQACNVFWQVGSAAILGGSSHLVGTVMAGTSITVGTGATIAGRVLAQALVTLDSDTITRPSCAASSSPGPTPGSTPDRELYCDAAGNSYNLEVGQDKLPPYDKLGLVPAYVDPVTGAKSCNFPTAATPTTTAATTTTTSATTTTSTTTSTPVAPKPVAKPKPKKAGVAAAKKTKAVAKTTVKTAVHTPPQPATHHVGVTG